MGTLSLASAAVWAVAVYATVGALFAAAFVWRGAGAIDPVAQHAPLRVRLIFFPGALALWPLLALTWSRARGDAG